MSNPEVDCQIFSVILERCRIGIFPCQPCRCDERVPITDEYRKTWGEYIEANKIHWRELWNSIVEESEKEIINE